MLVENQREKNIKVLRTNRGGEYTSNMFEEFCVEHGIDHEVTAPNTPQHNGIVERRNMIILDMERCMLKQKSFPKSLWGEVVSNAIYIVNRFSNNKLKNEVPKEV